MTTKEAIARFEREYIGYHAISPQRGREQVKLLETFAATLEGRSITEATADDLQAFAACLVEDFHVNTVRKKLNMIRPFVSWAFAIGAIDADRYMKLKGVKDPRGATGASTPIPYKRTEVQAFWLAVAARLPLIPEKGPRSQALTRWLQGKGPWFKVRDHAMRLQVEAAVRLALDLGLRRHEIFSLTVDDLHYDNEYLVVNGKADGNTGVQKPRKVPMTDTARGALYRWLEFRALLRPEHDSPWLSLWTVAVYDRPMRERRFATLLQDVIGPEWRWHRFRHTCATVWLRSGMRLELVSDLLGHATLEQTRAYAQVTVDDIARAMTERESNFNEGVGNVAA